MALFASDPSRLGGSAGRGMRIVVHHLTRMQSGLICVAGLNAKNQHIRPVARSVGLTPNLLGTNGGPFAVGAVVDLGRTKFVGKAPEFEDYLFDLQAARQVDAVSGGKFWALLREVAHPRLADIFGPDLIPRGRRSCGVDIGRGSASLGCLALANKPELYVEPRFGRNSIRLRVHDGHFDLDLSVADIRLYGPDHLTPDPKEISAVRQRIEKRAAIILSVGLSRAFTGSTTGPPLHWLQVNNLHFEDGPC